MNFIRHSSNAVFEEFVGRVIMYLSLSGTGFVVALMVCKIIDFVCGSVVFNLLLENQKVQITRISLPGYKKRILNSTSS